MDTYFAKLQSGALKTQVTSCADDMVEHDVQTEDLGMEDKTQQAPDDQMISAPPARSSKGVPSSTIHSRASAKNEALQLEKFMMKACPVVE